MWGSWTNSKPRLWMVCTLACTGSTVVNGVHRTFASFLRTLQRTTMSTVVENFTPTPSVSRVPAPVDDCRSWNVWFVDFVGSSSNRDGCRGAVHCPCLTKNALFFGGMGCRMSCVGVRQFVIISEWGCLLNFDAERQGSFPVNNLDPSRSVDIVQMGKFVCTVQHVIELIPLICHRGRCRLA